MGKANANSNNWLNLLFKAVAIANVADNAATAPLTNLYFALHTADPGAAGTQATSEISYTGYARVAVARQTAVGGFTTSAAQSTSPSAIVGFPPSTGGTGGTATFFSIGIAVSGATQILYSGAITPTIAVANGVTPQLTAATTITEV